MEERWNKLVEEDRLRLLGLLQLPIRLVKLSWSDLPDGSKELLLAAYKMINR